MNNQTSLSFIKTITLLYYAILTGMLLFAVVVVFLNSGGEISSSTVENQQTFLLVSVFTTISGIAASRFIFQQQLPALKSMDDLTKKTDKYKALLIMKFALLEGPALINIVFYLLTSHYVFALLFGLILILFILQRPTVENIRFDLNLSHEEVEKLK